MRPHRENHKSDRYPMGLIPTYQPKKVQCKNPDCERMIYQGLEKFCSKGCKIKVNGYPKTKGVKVSEKARQPIRKQSLKRAEQMKEYLREVKKWKVGKMCAVFPYLKAVDCHHIKGRSGALLLDKRYWLPVSREAHTQIELNPNWARENGYILNRKTT